MKNPDKPFPNSGNIYSNETTLLSSLLGQKILVIGHRGLGKSSLENKNLPENTIPSFQMAFIDGADMVELDVTLTYDEQTVVFHDDFLDRTTDGIGSIQNYNLETIRKLDAGKGTIWENRNIRLTTLREVFFFILKKNLSHSVNIELKPYNGSKRAGFLYRKIMVSRVIQLIDEFSVKDRVIISSFDLRMLVLLRQQRPDLLTALLAHGLPWNMEKMTGTAVKLGINGIHPNFAIIKSKDEVTHAKDKALFVQPYTLNTDKEFQKAIKFGVTGIITDVPGVLYDFLKNIKKQTAKSQRK